LPDLPVGIAEMVVTGPILRAQFHRPLELLDGLVVAPER
jgi:hypothetical protein